MIKFEKYRRTQIAEMRVLGVEDILCYARYERIPIDLHLESKISVSISDEDRKNGSPKIGDMIARNPKNHNDQWLVAQQYFKDNFEQLEEK